MCAKRCMVHAERDWYDEVECSEDDCCTAVLLLHTEEHAVVSEYEYPNNEHKEC